MTATEQVLVVCTGNICRSPMVAAILRRRLAEAGAGVVVSSAGLVTEDRPAHEHTVAVLAPIGIDLRDHRSRRMTRPIVEASDLILGMERAHVREAVAISPSVWPRTFTLKELVRRSRSVGPRVPDQALRDWLAEVHAGRESSMLLGADAVDDIADPLGGSRATFEATLEEVQWLLGELVEYAFPKS